MMYYLRLMRPTNMTMVVLTMYSIGFYLDILYFQGEEWGSIIMSFPFFLFVLSTVLVAGAGNVINDYFDVEADIVNKPDKVIVGRKLAIKNVFIFYIVLNILSLLIVSYISFLIDDWILLLIYSFSITALWFYSKRLKKVLFLSNILIAFLTSLVSFQVGLYFSITLPNADVFIKSTDSIESFSSYALTLGGVFGLLAFGLNWLREVVKDMEDLQGDKRIASRSIPIVYGLEKAKFIYLIFVSIVLLHELVFIYVVQMKLNSVLPMIPVWLNLLFLIYSSIVLYYSTEVKDFRKASFGLKVSMVFIIILPFYWAINHYILE